MIRFYVFVLKFSILFPHQHLCRPKIPLISYSLSYIFINQLLKIIVSVTRYHCVTTRVAQADMSWVTVWLLDSLPYTSYLASIQHVLRGYLSNRRVEV